LDLIADLEDIFGEDGDLFQQRQHQYGHNKSGNQYKCNHKYTSQQKSKSGSIETRSLKK